MRAQIISLLITLASAGSAFAENAPTCAQLAPELRAQAVEGANLLASVRRALPDDIEMDAEDGNFPTAANAAKAGLSSMFPGSNGLALGNWGQASAYLLPILQKQVEAAEIAAAVMEACAKP